MPASSVSLSNINIAPMTSANSAAVTPARAPLQGDGGGRSFGQWLQQAQTPSAQGCESNGESLPDEGKTLPVERQQQDRQSSVAEQPAVADSAGEPMPVEQASRAIGEKVKSEQDAQTQAGQGSVDQTLDIEAKPASDGEVAPQELAGDSGMETEGDTGAYVDGQQGAAGNADGEAGGGVSVADPVDLTLPGEKPSENSGEKPAVDKRVVLDGRGSGDIVEVDGSAAPDRAQKRGLEGLESRVGQRVEETVDESLTATAEPQQDTRRQLPEQAARTDVRDAALQNRGQLGAGADTTAGEHGRRVSEIARGPVEDSVQSEEAQAPLQPIDGPTPSSSDGAQGRADGGEAILAADNADVRADTAGNVPPPTSEPQQDSAIAEDAGMSVAADTEVLAETAVPVSSNRGDLSDQSLSARELQARGAPGSQSTASHTAGVLGGAGQSAASGDQQAGGQQSGGQGANRNLELQQTVSPPSAATGNQSSVVSDVDRQSLNGRQATTVGGESRASAESGAASLNPAQQALNTPKTDIMSQAAMQRLQDPAWSQAMGQRAIMMAQYGPRTAEIQLDPPELGLMQIRIHLGANDQVSVSFSSPHASVRDVIDQQMPRLREMFAEQGLELSQSSVSDQSNSGGDRDGSSTTQGRGDSGEYGDQGDGVETLASLQSVPVGLVDYYA